MFFGGGSWAYPVNNGFKFDKVSQFLHFVEMNAGMLKSPKVAVFFNNKPFFVKAAKDVFGDF